MLHSIEVTVNCELVKAKVSSHMRLVDFLREELDLIGAKEGCGKGECGACTVLVNGRPVNSCLMLAVEASGQEVLTVEGLSLGDHLDPIQQSIIDNSAFQCGYCTPGIVMSAKGLLLRNPSPTRDEVVEAVSGNLCRCTGYGRIIDAIMQVAASSKSQDEGSEG